jgi:hypothetical protein
MIEKTGSKNATNQRQQQHQKPSSSGSNTTKLVSNAPLSKSQSHAEVHVPEVSIHDVQNSAVYLLLQMGMYSR